MTRLRKLFLGIFSILFWTWFILTNIIMFSIAFVIWLITLPFDKQLAILHLFSCFWGHSYIWLNPLWPTTITGRKNIKRGRVYVIISNHQSMLDILVLYGLFRHYKWVSKKENFSIPIIGWLMRLNRYLEIDRRSMKSYVRFMEQTIEVIKKGNSVLMFPEGTRHPGGYIGPFREGAFKMALDSKVGILPVILDGTGRAIPKGSIILPGRQRITVKVFEEISYESFKDKIPKKLMQEMKLWMEREYETFARGMPAGEMS